MVEGSKFTLMPLVRLTRNRELANVDLHALGVAHNVVVPRDSQDLLLGQPERATQGVEFLEGRSANVVLPGTL